MLLGVSLTLVGAALLGPWVGRWQDRSGSRLVMSLGSVLVAAGLGAIALAKGPVLYFLGWILLALATPMVLYNAAFTALTQLAGKDARRAIIYLTFLGGLASTVAWPTAAFLMERMGWREVVGLFALANLAICLPLHIVLLPSGARHRAATAAVEPVAAELPSAEQPRAFGLLAGMLAVNSLIFNAWSLLVFPVLEGLGFDRLTAVSVASFVGVCQVIGRMGEMALGGRFNAFQSARFAIGLLPLAFAVLAFSSGQPLLGFAFAVIYGVSNGLVTIARGALTLSVFGSRGYGEQFGKVTLASGLAGAVAPVLGGFAIESLGVPALIGLMFAAACLSLGLMLALFRHWHRHRVVG